MPAQILVDFSHIDLNAVAVSPAEVAQLNPQTGHMRQLHHVIWMAPDYTRSLGVKYVRHDEFWVPGHIPGKPLLPGVIMIEAGAQLASVAYRHRIGSPKEFMAFTHIDNAVFRAQVVPGDTLYLLAHERRVQPRRFISDIQGVVRGTLAFEARISGKVIPARSRIEPPATAGSAVE